MSYITCKDLAVGYDGRSVASGLNFSIDKGDYLCIVGEIGPDESMEDALDTAELLEKIIGEEEVEKMDGLLSLAITGGDCNWI